VSITVVGGMTALVAGTVWAGVREVRRARWRKALIAHLNASLSPICCLYGEGFRTDEINGQRTRWQPFIIALTPSQVAIYDGTPGTQEPCFTLAPDQLRWFGRPQKYHGGRNDIWLHVEIDQQWVVVKLRLYRYAMQDVVRALKAIATPEQVTAYRRRRPYIHYGPVTAQPIDQDMLGAWVLHEPVSLYLMPSHLVVLDGVTVRQAIPLETIQAVSAVRRADRWRAAGLVRFQADGQPLAFALQPYEAFANALGEAARRTLEDPVEWLARKKKKPTLADDLDDDEDFS
jgi:hypothetical protein